MPQTVNIVKKLSNAFFVRGPDTAAESKTAVDRYHRYFSEYKFPQALLFRTEAECFLLYITEKQDPFQAQKPCPGQITGSFGRSFFFFHRIEDQ